MDTVAQPHEALSQLACLGCRSRKIKCDRIKPTCNGCFARQQGCIYPERKARKRMNIATELHKSSPRNHSRLRDGVLSSIFDRILQVEEQCLRLGTASPQDEPPAISRKCLANDVNVHLNQPTTSSAHSPSKELAAKATGSKIDNDTIKTEPILSCHVDSSIKPLNADTRLQEALKQVLHLRRQSLDSQTANVARRIPAEVLKACLDNFFKHNQVDIFPYFINIKLMYQLPDIIDMPEIRVDPAALILFYSLLYHGSLTLSEAIAPQDGKLTQAMYAQCLGAIPAWQNQVSGTKMDLMTAFLMMRAAFQQCNLEFSWRMYDLVCHCVKNLNMHNLDQTVPNSSLDTQLYTESPDQHRKGFWSLVLVDFFFQLLHGKPAIITANAADWRVNLPSMNTTPDNAQHAASTLTFLVKFRLALIFLQFFDMLSKNEEGKAGVIKRIEALYEEIEALFREWSVADSMAAYEENDGSWWMLYDITLTAYCSMIIMSRRLSYFQSDLSGTSGVSVPTLSVNIARRIIELVNLGLAKYPTPVAAYCVFGAYRCYVAYGCLAEYLSFTNPASAGPATEADMVLLEEVSQRIAAIAGKDKDLIPLVRTVYQLTRSIRATWEEK